MKKLILVLLLASSLTACTSTEVIPVTSGKDDVKVYMSENDVPTDYEVIAEIKDYDWGFLQRLTFNDSIPNLKKQAIKLHADAIIIEKNEVVYSGIVTRGYDITAKAVKLVK